MAGFLSCCFFFVRCPRLLLLLPWRFVWGIWMIMDSNIEDSMSTLLVGDGWCDRSPLVVLCFLIHAAVNGQFLRGLGGRSCLCCLERIRNWWRHHDQIGKKNLKIIEDLWIWVITVCCLLSSLYTLQNAAPMSMCLYFSLMGVCFGAIEWVYIRTPFQPAFQRGVSWWHMGVQGSGATLSELLAQTLCNFNWSSDAKQAQQKHLQRLSKCRRHEQVQWVGNDVWCCQILFWWLPWLAAVLDWLVIAFKDSRCGAHPRMLDHWDRRCWASHTVWTKGVNASSKGKE